jgi:hypothetical protein
VIAQKDGQWFDQFWNIKNKYGGIVWHYAAKDIKSEFFWEIIVQKDDQWFEKFWNIKDKYERTV